MSSFWQFALVMGLAALIVAAYAAGYKRGREIERDEWEAAAREAEDTRDKIDEDVKNRPDDQLDRDVDKWMRD